MKMSNPFLTSFSTTKPAIAQAITPTANIHINRCVILLHHLDPFFYLSLKIIRFFFYYKKKIYLQNNI